MFTCSLYNTNFIDFLYIQPQCTSLHGLVVELLFGILKNIIRVVCRLYYLQGLYCESELIYFLQSGLGTERLFLKWRRRYSKTSGHAHQRGIFVDESEDRYGISGTEVAYSHRPRNDVKQSAEEPFSQLSHLSVFST